MQIFTCSRTSLKKERSEDAFTVNRKTGTFGVFDGATPLVPFFDGEGRNGAYLASHTFQQFFDSMEAAVPLKEAVCRANRALLELMLSHGIDIQNKVELWSTCVAVVRFEDDGRMSFAHLGDSMVMVERSDGSVDVVTKDTVRDIGKRARLKRERDRASGADVPEESYFVPVSRQLLYNRAMANTPDGYTVANGTPETEQYIHEGRVSLQDARSVLLITDGLFAPEQTMAETFRRIKEHGLEGYAQQLEETERSNGSPSDDKTGIRIIL